MWLINGSRSALKVVMPGIASTAYRKMVAQAHIFQSIIQPTPGMMRAYVIPRVWIFCLCLGLKLLYLNNNHCGHTVVCKYRGAITLKHKRFPFAVIAAQIAHGI